MAGKGANTGAMILEGLGVISDMYFGIKAHKEASKAARAEARAEGVLTSAKLAQLLQEERIMRGQTISGAAASGVKTGTGQYGGPASSVRTILDEQATRFAEERMTVAKVGATKSSMAIQRGSMVGTQVMGQTVGNISSRASNVFSLWADR